MFYFGVFIVLFIVLAYVSLLIWLYVGLKRLPQFTLSNTTIKTSFSIVIVLRNEAANLPSLLQSLSELKYSNQLFELVFVDDASIDDSVFLIEKFIAKHPRIKTRLLSNLRKSAAPKKDAISLAIQSAKNEWILLTDADCLVPNDWLTTYNDFIDSNSPVFIAGPVLYRKGVRFIHKFQELDWLSLVGTTIGSFGWNKPILCSGANLAYQKEIFEAVGGFQGNEHIASGDDIFLMHKMHSGYPEQVFYMNAPTALVTTAAEDSWKALYNQRIRWAKKTSNVPSLFSILIGICVFLMNLLLLVLVVGSFIEFRFLLFFVSSLLVKLFVDFLLLVSTSNKTGAKINLKNCLSSSLLYPVFSTSIVFSSLFSKYSWKGKSYSK